MYRIQLRSHLRGTQTHLVTPASGICHTLIVQSSLALAITLSLCGHHCMSSTGPLCPATRGTSAFIRPVLASGRTRKAPPPPDSTITATNLGLTAQKVESQLDLDTRMLS